MFWIIFIWVVMGFTSTLWFAKKISTGKEISIGVLGLVTFIVFSGEADRFGFDFFI